MDTADRLDALDYHELTKHSVASVSSNRHFLDWDTQPLPFKLYPHLKPIPLPRDFSRQQPSATIDRLTLARLLHFTGGIMRKKTLADGSEYYFRAAACTGALYHIDLYVVCGDVVDLPAGVYHFGPHDFSLRRLRHGDHRRTVVDAGGDHPALASAPVILVCTSTFWRNAWKYQARTYRHCFWDNGTMLANLLEVAATAQVPAEIVLGFADTRVNELLALDTDREVALSLVALGDRAVAAIDTPRPSNEQSDVQQPHNDNFRGEIDYPAIRAAHAGSSFESGEEARRWRTQTFKRVVPEPTGKLIPLSPPGGPVSARMEEVIARRGSARYFLQQPIEYEALAHLLRSALPVPAADWLPREEADTGESSLNDIYLIVNAVDGLAPGAYVCRRDLQALELLKAGDFRRQAGHLDLGQELAADASVNFYCLSDLVLVDSHLGNRGYRAAALEAAIVGGRIYLAAYALGLGATGLTFFDDDVTQFFSPHAAGKEVMFLTAVGRTGSSRRKASR